MPLVLTKNMDGGGKRVDFAAYARGGGYEAVRKVVGKLAPADVVQVVADSGLAGCGGGGFPTGRKWQAMPSRSARPGPRYFIVNADEMEPGTFKDRYLMEGDPHQLLEGIVLAAYAVEADEAYIFVRGEYFQAIAALEAAIAEAQAAGVLGGLTIHVHAGVGRYICGEETALLNSLEGKRAIPRAKPPLPQVSGLFGCPTIVNNVETVCNVPHIVRHGAEWFRGLGVGDEAGTKIFGVSGRVNRPGVYELPMGTSLRVLIEEFAGGMRDGFQLRAVLPGGASTGFLGVEKLDTPMSVAGMAAAGSRLGTGNVMVLDDKTCPVGFIRNLQHFFAQESCGWCAPCRDGLPWVDQILAAMETGQGRQSDLAVLADMPGRMGPGKTFCGLAPGAMASLETGLKMFAQDFTRHVQERVCAWA
jgi:NADH-quinone oxidoreductase subunit F